MKAIMKNLVTLVGIILLGIGIGNATPSFDCGDDDVEPISTHSAMKASYKES